MFITECHVSVLTVCRVHHANKVRHSKNKDLQDDVAQEVKRVLEDRAVSERPPHEFYHTCQRHSPGNVQQQHIHQLVTSLSHT